MTQAGPEGRLQTEDRVLAALFAAIVLAISVAGAQLSEEAGRERRAREAAEAAGRVSAGVGVDLERGLRGIAAAARSVPSGGLGAIRRSSEELAPAATDVGFVSVTGQLPTAGAPLLTADHREDEEIAALLDRARDAATAQLGPPVDTPEGPRTPLVAAAYRAGPSADPPVTPADRRGRLAGWVVALVDTEELVARHEPSGADVALHDAGASSAGAGSGDATQVLEVAERAFLVEASVVDGDGIRAATVVLLAIGGVLAAVGAGWVLAARGQRRQALALVADRESQVRLIGDVAPLVQQSLDLAEVLPAVAVQLSDHFDLAGVTLSTGTSRAGQTELFSTGVAPDPDVKPTLQPPGRLASGETLNLALQRGGRSVALLQIVAGRTLDSAELDSLRALSELVTASMVNAALYASQQDALARMRELDGLKTVFLGTASHELRTPATAIAGFAGLLTSSWDRFTDDQRRDFVNRIGANARSLSAVVQDLLDFSLFDRGTISVAVERVDLSTVVGDVLDRLAPAFAEHTVETDLQPTDPVEGDLNGLERITTNLLSNAVKFSPSGTTIRVSVRAQGSDVLLEVCDQGPGVPAAERERVFTRFYRGTGDAVLATRGVGIGLSVVSEFVARMRGEVCVDDAPGGGARFTVRLPAARPHPAEEVADATAP